MNPANWTRILLTALTSCYLHISFIVQKMFADVICILLSELASYYLHSANKGCECSYNDAKNAIFNGFSFFNMIDFEILRTSIP